MKGYAPSLNANPDLAWEKSTAFNIGLDFVTLNNRLRGSVEFYDRRSKDLLYNYTAPQPPFIYNTILVNVGTTKNAGVEVSLDYDVIAKKDFKWTTGANWSMGDTKLTKLSSDVYKAAYLELYQKPGLGTSEYFFRVEEGGKIGSFKYKNWDLSMLMRGAFGFKIFNMRKYGMGLQGAGTDNVLRTAYTDDADVKSSGGIITSYFLENGNYFKMDNVTLGYSFIPKKREIIESLRVYLTAKNLFTITAYKGNDPSIVTSTGIEPGVDSNSAYPQATQLTLGVTVRFH